jgi:hypothetical protein
MKRIVATGTILLSLWTVAGSAQEERIAVMRRDVFVPELAVAARATFAPGEIAVCIDWTEAGCYVLCRDAAGEPCVGFVPQRTEWGHVSVVSWRHDLSVPPGHVRMLTQARAQPGAIPLKAGAEYPLIADGGETLRVRFAAGELTREVEIAAADAAVTVRTAAKPPAPTREERREADLARAEAQTKKLRADLCAADKQRARLAGLVERAQLADIENARLTAETEAARLTYRRLAAWKPDSAADIKTLKAELGGLIAGQADLQAQLQCADLTIQPLRFLYALQRDAGANSEELAARVAAGVAESEAVRAARENPVTEEDRTKIREVLNRTVAEHAHLVRITTEMELGRQAIDGLVSALQTVREENAQLAARVEDLTEDLEKIRALRDPQPGAATAPLPFTP